MFVQARKIMKRSRGLAALVLAGLLLMGPEAIGGGGAMAFGDDEMVGTLPCSTPVVLPEPSSNGIWDVAPGLYLEGSDRAIDDVLANGTGCGFIYRRDLGNDRARITLVGEVQLDINESLFQNDDLVVGIQTNFEVEAVMAKVVQKRILADSFEIAPATDFELPIQDRITRGLFDEEVRIYTSSSIHGNAQFSFHTFGGVFHLGQR